MGADLTLQFAQEVIIVNGMPVIGTVTIEVEGELDRYDGLWSLDLTPTAFEPESAVGLTWSDVRGSCEAWLAANRSRVEKKALR